MYEFLIVDHWLWRRRWRALDQKVIDQNQDSEGYESPSRMAEDTDANRDGHERNNSQGSCSIQHMYPLSFIPKLLLDLFNKPFGAHRRLDASQRSSGMA